MTANQYRAALAKLNLTQVAGKITTSDIESANRK
jgi:hypothetical protein